MLIGWKEGADIQHPMKFADILQRLCANMPKRIYYGIFTYLKYEVFSPRQNTAFMSCSWVKSKNSAVAIWGQPQWWQNGHMNFHHSLIYGEHGHWEKGRVLVLGGWGAVDSAQRRAIFENRASPRTQRARVDRQPNDTLWAPERGHVSRPSPPSDFSRTWASFIADVLRPVCFDFLSLAAESPDWHKENQTRQRGSPWIHHRSEWGQVKEAVQRVSIC